ncbi:MAG TPA: M20/M25/M40 family metallo-hydrolase [Vicinamibacterales bacterium]|nr:M20/M25/M40 family metallo-hydrolase [Vicinamibacterales bacterium]
MKSVVRAAALAAILCTSASADVGDLRRYVTTLASERFGGRLTGTDGERLAREFIVGELKRIGARPLPGHKDFALPFEFTAGARDGGTTVSVGGKARGLSFSDSGEVTAPVVFAGYGIVVPDSQDFGYDSYAGLDVKDKIVVVLRYFPEDADQKTRSILARYSDLRYKAMAARQRGAKAMLVVTGSRSPNAGELVPMTFDTALSGSGIVAASIDGDAGKAIFSHAGTTLDAAQQSLDSGNPHVAGFAIPTTVTVTTKVERERHTAFNIAGYLPATDRVAMQKPWLAIGAHYDHLGRGENGSSLASKEEAGRIHGGADDNASGDAAVLELASALAKQPRRRNVMLTFWSGEELGLLGSAAFLAAPPVKMSELAAYLNFDMVGRMQDNKLSVQAGGTSKTWDKLVEQANVKAGFNVTMQPDPYQPTDVANFNTAGVPCLNFFTGAHTDYHKPSDTADKINYEDLDRIVDFAASIARRLEDADEPPVFAKVEPQAQGGATRAGVRVFTGTVPDYATEAKGLLLGGVVAGGPAEAAGLQKGDLIVEIAGQSIANIYDYTYALDVLKIGQPAKVVYMRNGERKETTLTPAARK